MRHSRKKRPAARARGAGKVRVACVQLQARKVAGFAEFAESVEYFVAAAAAAAADFVVFPEFFSVALLSSLAPQPPPAGLRRLARFAPAVSALLAGLARRHQLHVLAGSQPRFTGGRLRNTALLFRPDGRCVAQDKLHITPSERVSWGITGGNALELIATPKAKIGILICYDVEFPEAARHLADAGADILFVPFCTDNRPAYLRVRYCAQARAVENQLYVVTAGLVGNLPSVPDMDIHYGQAAVFTPSDSEFARDGILAQADANIETLLLADLDLGLLRRARERGSVTPRLDRRKDLFKYRHSPRRGGG